MNDLYIYIGLGSNLGESMLHVRDAIEEIKSMNNCDLIKKSSLYKTPPMGPPDQPDYINAVIKIQSSVRAIELLDELQKIEQLHDRVREIKWGSRSLDLDILIYGSLKFDTYKLKIPHPGLYVRAFVLYPLLEIEPELTLPNGVSLVKHVELMGKQDIVKLT